MRSTGMPRIENMETGSGLRHRSATIDGGNHEDNTKGQTTSSSLPNSPDRSTSHPHLPAPQTNTKSKRETYKVQKKNYRSQKKEAAKELLSTITDPSVVLLGDWLKVRGTLKSWTKLWCVLKPGVLILYKSDKQKRSQWVGTILLNTCQLLERPSKKDGFCFKLFHPLDQSIWATKGPNGETIGAFVQPLPYSYCIFRAPSESAGKCWMDALELALKCTNLLKRSMTRSETCTPETNSDMTTPIGIGSKEGTLSTHDDLNTSIGEEYPPNHDSHNHEDFSPMCMQESMNESDLERHFANQGNRLHIEGHAIHDDFSSEPGYHEHIEPDPTGILPDIYYKDVALISSCTQKQENSLNTFFLKKQEVQSKLFEKVSEPDCKSENERNSAWGGDIGNKQDYNVSQSVEKIEKTITRSFTLASDRVKSEQIPQPLGTVAAFHRQGIPGKRVLHEKLDVPIKEAISRINRPQCRKDRFFELIAPFENISQKNDTLKTEASDPLLVKKEPGMLKRIYSPDTKKSSELTESFMKVLPPSSVEMVRPTVFHPQDEMGPVFKEGQQETTPVDKKLNPSAAKFLDTSSLNIKDPSHKNLQRISSEHNRKPMHSFNNEPSILYWLRQRRRSAAHQTLANNGLDDDKSEREDSESGSQSEFEEDAPPGQEILEPPVETKYVENKNEELGQSGDFCQTEEVTDENKSLIWTLVKQVRPGMDLSKVVLPTFILEPRSFLDKLSDYYYHADILSQAILQDSPYQRMKYVVQWYLSGFYKKPKGLKKPYNPVIGEVFRCYWYHPKTGSRTFYIAEQVSHHPPISVFHVTNRKDGFNISGTILTRSKFYGNSLSAILDGVAVLTFLERGEDYFITMPYAHCKGILIGTLTMEMGGKVTIDCPKTGYKCEIEFKLKPLLSTGQASNRIHGKINMGSDTLALLDGHWDQEIYFKDRQLRKKDVFWNPSNEVRAQRLHRFTVPVKDQCEFESERVWEKVSKAIIAADVRVATEEKYKIEELQRKETRERKSSNVEWKPRFFEKDYLSGSEWIYKHADDRPWDLVNDVYQYEHDFVIQTQTRHSTTHLRTSSHSSLNKKMEKKKVCIPHTVDESDSSGHGARRESDSSDFTGPAVRTGTGGSSKAYISEQNLRALFDPLVNMQRETVLALRGLQQQVVRMQNVERETGGRLIKDWFILAIILIFQIILQWIFR